MSIELLNEIDTKLDQLHTRFNEAKLDVTASKEIVLTLEQSRKVLMEKAVNDPQAAKEAVKIDEEIISARRMLAISNDIHDQIQSHIVSNKTEARKAEKVAQTIHTNEWELKQAEAMEAAIEAMRPHIINAAHAGYARGLNVSASIGHTIKVAVNKLCSPHNPDIDREAVKPPSSRHLNSEDRSAVSNTPRDPIALQNDIDERLERERIAKEKNAQLGEASRSGRRSTTSPMGSLSFSGLPALKGADQLDTAWHQLLSLHRVRR